MIDYKGIKTNREKLFACYALVEQMRLEHNKVTESFRDRLTLEPVPKDKDERAKKKAQGFIRDWCPEGFMLADTPENNSLRAKFRTYAHESKARQKQLLAERNSLIESIRWANYTPAQWKATNKLSPEEQDAIYETLFGDKVVEKVKTTKATSSVLDELKALNLDAMPETLGSDPTEDFTTYTEVDPGSDISKTADRTTFTALDTRNSDSYVYKDKEVGHFDGDFEHLLKTYLSSMSDAASYLYLWVLANAVDDFNGLDSGSCLGLYSYGTDYDLDLREVDSGTAYVDGGTSENASTVYFLEIERDEAVGTYGTIYAYICTGDYWDDGGTQIETLSLALHTSKKDYRYIYSVNTFNTGMAAPVRAATGYVELLDLQEVTFRLWTIIM